MSPPPRMRDAEVDAVALDAPALEGWDDLTVCRWHPPLVAPAPPPEASRAARVPTMLAIALLVALGAATLGAAFGTMLAILT